ncbi:MAG TPA: cyclic nucleotide-binding domain-containing protein [Ramlibacter sp.]|nr:cyclic nucleotide-binding domain-containing protein [Ramlibacter sp.]
MHRFTFEDGARLLMSQAALPDLKPDQALRVVQFMRLTLARRGAVLFRAGGPGSHFMVMLLDGDAVVEGQLNGATDPLVLRSLVPGSLFGELGAMDTIARSVTVRATSDTCLATLDYAALNKVTETDPVLGCALLRAILAHVTRRLRNANTKIETLNEINQTLRKEWQAEMNNDRATIARLNVLMKLEQKIGMLPAARDKLDSLSPAMPEPGLPAMRSGKATAAAPLK